MDICSYRSPKTEFKISPIEGKGRFAKEAIATGEVIAIRSGHIIDHDMLITYRDVIDDAEHQIADNFYLAPLCKEEFQHVMCFINHSCTPNLGLQGNIVIVAMRDILAGEELCLDYAMVFSNEKRFRCRCQSATCRQEVTGSDWMRRDLQTRYAGYFSSYLAHKISQANC